MSFARSQSSLLVGGASVSLVVSWIAWNHFGGTTQAANPQVDGRLVGGSVTKAAKEWWSKHAAKLFQEADLNKDGTLDMGEVYDLVLKFYIDINRTAPIPPPSRSKVLTLLRKSKSDKDNSGTIDEQEFERLLATLYGVASSRVVAHKIVSNVVAPLAAVAAFDFLKGSLGIDWTGLLGYLPAQTPTALVKTLSEEKTWVALLTGIFCKPLLAGAVEVVNRLTWGENAEETLYGMVSDIKQNLDQ